MSNQPAQSKAGLQPSQPDGSTNQFNAKQYDRIRILGKGSFGVASVHRRRADCSLVVLKEIDLHRFKGEQERQSAINEARIMSTLSHVNIIKYYNAYATNSKLIIEMEYASIGTLRSYLSFQVQLLEEHEILIIFRQIVSGLNYLHLKNIIHLDLKMENIFVTIEGLVKIGDFGIAQYLYSAANDNNKLATDTKDTNDKLPAHNNKSSSPSKSRLTQKTVNNGKKLTSSHLGTLTYSSPERCLGEATDFKSDIWSLGCILYELITSKPMFSGDCLLDLILNITRVQYEPIRRSNIATGLIEIFQRMIAREPKNRPSAEDLLCITNQLVSRTQLQRATQNRQVIGKHQSGNNGRAGFDLSTELAQIKAHSSQEDVSQINYPHSLVYQVRLNSRNIHMDRVNLPQTKRIKGMSKGGSHYLVLTYDNIVYGWGSKNYGQLGACGLSSSSAAAVNKQQQKLLSTSSRSSAIYTSKTDLLIGAGESAASSLSSSTQTIAMYPPGCNNSYNYNNCTTKSMPSINNTGVGQFATPMSASNQHLSKQVVMSMLKESQPSSRPFIINELNHRKIVQVGAGKNFSVFLSKTGIVMTCGDGSTGCLGRGDLKSSYTPCMVESLLNTDVVNISCGPEHVVAICGNGRAFAWGKNKHGRLGIGRAGGYDAQVETDPDGTLNRCLRDKIVLRPQPVKFPPGVFIKSVFCADKSTVFIDSENRCWACGENRFNKLGLDIKRRFKRNLIVNKSWTPTEIVALSKYKIIMCNIGKNHSSFVTSEGKLIVSGQDIDHSYRLKSNIVCARDSHRKIALELQTKRCLASSNQLKQFQNNRQRDSSLRCDQLRSIAHEQTNYGLNLPFSSATRSYRHKHQKLVGCFKHSNTVKSSNDPADEDTGKPRKKPARYKLNRFQRVQIDSYVSKSRSIKKMPFECVVSVSCTSKFTLALTSDNRVYFWGTRSYKKEGAAGMCPPAGSISIGGSHSRNRFELNSGSHEPQLVAGCSDQCFIKIGATNSSLMSSIQVLGSDHPIIHAQDPHLVAKSLADLWILDYRPSRQFSCCSSSSSTATSASSSRSDLNRLALKQNSSISTSRRSSSSSTLSDTGCSSCCPECNNVSAIQSDQENTNNYDKDDDELDDCMNYAAILEPQPIVSLYVPSMFNNINNNCSLHLVDLFCFDEDRFYLILDTTVKLQHFNVARQTHTSTTSGAVTTTQPLSNGATPSNQTKTNAACVRLRSNPALLDELTNPDRRQSTSRQASNLDLTRAADKTGRPDKIAVSVEERAEGSRTVAVNNLPVVMKLAQKFEKTTRLRTNCNQEELNLPDERAQRNHREEDEIFKNVSEAENGDGEEELARLGNKAKLDDCCIDGNNNDTQHTDCTAVSSSQGGVSLEEPRSLSTFAAPSLGNHIIVGPTMRSLDIHQQPLEPLAFGNGSGSGGTGHHSSHILGNSASCCGSQDVGTGSGSCGSSNSQQRIENALVTLNRRSRSQTNKSDSTTAFTCNDIDETSSMPSWVRNEYIQQKDGFQANLFATDSSATEDTCMSELVVTESSSSCLGGEDGGSENGDGSSVTMASFNQNSINFNTTVISYEQTSTPTIFGQQRPAMAPSASSKSSLSSVKSIKSSKLSRSSSSASVEQIGSGLTPIAGEEEAAKTDWRMVESGVADNGIAQLLDYGKPPLVQDPTAELGEQQVIGPNLAILNGSPIGQTRSGLSRSQPDISEHELNGISLRSSQIRRASIVADDCDQTTGTNLLHCGVYRASSQLDGSTPQYQSSSNFNSTISTRSNSHNLLIRPDPGSCFELCTVSHQRISNGGTSSPQTTQVGVVAAGKQHQATNGSAVDAAYLWSKLHSKNTDKLVNTCQQVAGSINQAHHYQHPHLYLAGRQLSKSNQPLPMSESKRHGSSSSLASLRKSLVKLFC